MNAQVLLVEEDCSVRDSLKRALQSEKYEVVTASDTGEARETMDRQHIDLLLVDVDSTQRDGWSGVGQLATSYMFLPVIIITARTGQQQRAAMSGADALMEKPLNFPVLVQTMSQLLEQTLEGRLHRLEEAYA